MRPQPPEWLSGRTVAVVGSGPAGLAAAQQLTRAGHTVAVYERADKIGGLLRYGIPEFKMEKKHLDKRLDQMRREGTIFRAGVVGRRRRPDRRAAARALRRRGARHGRHRGPRPAGARAVSSAASTRRWTSCRSPTGSRSARRSRTRSSRRQERRDHRRRRHRRRLPRHRDPPGRGVDHPARDHAGAARVAARRSAVADVPDDLPGLLGARGGGGAGLRRLHQGVPGRRRRQRHRRCAWSTWSSRAAS